MDKFEEFTPMVSKQIDYKQIQEEVKEVANFINENAKEGWVFVCVFGEYRLNIDTSYIFILFKKEI
jgi:hypothetical protein